MIKSLLNWNLCIHFIIAERSKEVKMKIYGLVGKSGSGKSYHAAGLCRKLGIESILDDGLLISANRVLAGVSAKRQDTKIRAIKTALFTDDAHKEAVAAKLAETSPASVLVIGTSERMIGDSRAARAA